MGDEGGKGTCGLHTVAVNWMEQTLFWPRDLRLVSPKPVSQDRAGAGWGGKAPLPAFQ